jgi:hypothetical protein
MSLTPLVKPALPACRQAWSVKSPSPVGVPNTAAMSATKRPARRGRRLDKSLYQGLRDVRGEVTDLLAYIDRLLKVYEGFDELTEFDLPKQTPHAKLVRGSRRGKE